MTDYAPQIRKLLGLLLAGFVLVCLSLTYWQVVRAPQLNAAPDNRRAQLRLRRVEPGRLYTSDSLILLDRHQTDKGWEATYPEGKIFAHLTGYNSVTGLQKGLCDALYAQNAYADPWHDLLRGQTVGNDVVLTINGAAQKEAADALSGQRGAVVALDPSTGATLVLASAPSYDPALVTTSNAEFDLFRFDPQSPELNRALQGLYPPGSVFKIFTAAVGLDLGLVTPRSRFTCAGEERVNRAKVVCRRTSGHGSLDLDWALADSCNIAFAKLGAQIGVDNFIAYSKKFHLLDQADLALPSKAGGMYDFRGFKGKVALAEAAFGQGATLMTPLQVARLTATIANQGEALQPFIVQSVESPEKQVRYRGQARDLGRAVSAHTAATVAGMMRDVVERGTGRGIALSGVSVAAKTGSAENPHGPAHAWFTCFAPVEKPRVVVTVVVEQGGAGSESALPIARRVLRCLLEQQPAGQ